MAQLVEEAMRNRRVCLNRPARPGPSHPKGSVAVRSVECGMGLPVWLGGGVHSFLLSFLVCALDYFWRLAAEGR